MTAVKSQYGEIHNSNSRTKGEVVWRAVFLRCEMILLFELQRQGKVFKTKKTFRIQRTKSHGKEKENWYNRKAA
jgi:hypothetical protein